ncbi:MAG TPA: alpha-amylase family glycosyl hydrolase [Anaerolineae bacterium]|nr:alpha-amylase family glycosyl hydrolase [Anaerolineae bacterium]
MLVTRANAGSADNNVEWAPVLHDSFDANYRSPGGPVTPTTTVKLRLRVGQSDITSARVRVWNDRTNSETYYSLAWDGSFDTDPTTYDYWFADIPTGPQPTILYYFFEINDGTDQDFYTDDDPQFYGGGYGSMRDNYDDQHSFQITVYDPSFSVPTWMQRGIVYQIFPDRFRDGDSANDPSAGRFFYDTAGGTIVRSSQSSWNYTICDPRNVYTPACLDKYSDNFYGGDLAGITEKINQGYFDNLGVSVLYLNPVFRSPSNHKYDTADYLAIDPDFGTLADFQALVSAANAHGIRLMLDGVFNHVSSDSPYFDRYRRYNAAGQLTTPGVGTDDQSGACESPVSAYRNWFYIPDTLGSPGNQPTDRCDGNDGDDPGGAWDQTYSAWWGYGSLPKLQATSAQVRNLIYSNTLNSVGPYWVAQGASGWRFDVGGDVDPGVTNDPANDYWESFRSAVRNQSVTGKSDVLMLGEEWGDASAWLLGNEWDSVMNYRFRSAVLGWLFTGCSGDGCVNPGTGNAYFEDNDSNTSSSSGEIRYLNPSLFNARLRAIEEDYPPMAWKAMLNIAGTHDTNRVRFLLKKINNGNDSAAQQRLKELWLFAFTYVGAPTLYYGDEVGLSYDGVWANNKWEDDPYNRIPFPWPDADGTSYVPLTNLQDFARKLASLRLSYRALQDGDVRHGLVIDDVKQLYGFARTITDTTSGVHTTALIALNRDGANHPVTLNSLNGAPYFLPDGTRMVEVINGGVYTVTGSAITLTVNSSWGVVLLEQNKIDRPAPGLQAGKSGADVVLSWRPVISDMLGSRELATRYELYRGASASFTPETGTLLTSTTPTAFGTTDGLFHYTDVGAGLSGYYYILRAFNAAGAYSDTTPLSINVNADLLVVQSTPPVSVTINVPVTYTLAIENAGPSEATSLLLTTTLASGIASPQITGPALNCSIANLVITCTLASLAPYASVPFTVTFNAPASSGVITHTLDVSSSSPDPNGNNNHLVITTTVNQILFRVYLPVIQR